MVKPLLGLAIVLALTLPCPGDEPLASSGVESSGPPETLVTDLPAGMKNFNGMLLGRLVSKDSERGTFVVTVDAVPRVWRNSRAENPSSVVGKTVEISGVFGKFLDVLVITRKGETVEFECKHDGDRLVFPGELLRKAAPYDPDDYPVLPEAFRGFEGAVAAEVIKKDPETLEMIVKVSRVLEPWKNNKAKDPKSIEGRTMMLAGFWQRKDDFHRLKLGDRIEFGMQHISRQSNHVSVAEFVRKSEADSRSGRMERAPERMREMNRGVASRGFRGMLVGRLKEKDAERGTFSIVVDAVPRVWKNNRFDRPKELIGKTIEAGGVQGKQLDVLVVTRIGETLEFGAFNDEGGRMRVVEVLRKTAPVEPGDYPELPAEARGIRGLVRGKVVKKDQQMMELIVKVTDIVQLFPANQAEKAESLVDHDIMLVGFWNRKDTYHSIRVGDVIEFGVEHPQRLSDHLSVIESVKKVD